MRSKRLHATMSALVVAVTAISAALADDAIWSTHDLTDTLVRRLSGNA